MPRKRHGKATKRRAKTAIVDATGTGPRLLSDLLPWVSIKFLRGSDRIGPSGPIDSPKGRIDSKDPNDPNDFQRGQKDPIALKGRWNGLIDRIDRFQAGINRPASAAPPPATWMATGKPPTMPTTTPRGTCTVGAKTRNTGAATTITSGSIWKRCCPCPRPQTPARRVSGIAVTKLVSPAALPIESAVLTSTSERGKGIDLDLEISATVRLIPARRILLVPDRINAARRGTMRAMVTAVIDPMTTHTRPMALLGPCIRDTIGTGTESVGRTTSPRFATVLGCRRG